MNKYIRNIKHLVDIGFWKEEVSDISVIPENANTLTCPNCKSNNTRRIQNALSFIKNPIFTQCEEWLGYCHECGTLYEYYTDKTMYVPKK